jgi:hypothetical protein
VESVVLKLLVLRVRHTGVDPKSYLHIKNSKSVYANQYLRLAVASWLTPDVSGGSDLDLLPNYVVGRTSVICDGLIDAVTLS